MTEALPPLLCGFGALLPAVLGLGLPVLCIVLARRRRLRGVMALGGAALAGGAMIAGLASATFLNGFGPGMFMVYVAAAMVPISLLNAVVLGSIVLLPTEDEPRYRSTLVAHYVVGALLIPLSLAEVPGGWLALSSRCDAWNREIGMGIVLGLEAAKRDLGAYPEELSALTPRYLAALPQARCMGMGDWLLGRSKRGTDFRLSKCRDTTWLTVPRPVDIGIQYYDLGTGLWSTVDPFSDDICSGPLD